MQNNVSRTILVPAQVACFLFFRVLGKFLFVPFIFCWLIVVSNLLFSQSYVEAVPLRVVMLTDVVDTSLEVTLPEIQRQFNELHTEVKTGNETVCEKVDGLGAKFEASLESRPTRTELAGGFAEMAVWMAHGIPFWLVGVHQTWMQGRGGYSDRS
jgi:hypothetical protein